MANHKVWMKSIAYSTVIIGTGVLLLKTTTPPIPPPVADAAQDHKIALLNDIMKRNMESSRPAWDIKWLEFCTHSRKE